MHVRRSLITFVFLAGCPMLPAHASISVNSWALNLGVGGTGAAFQTVQTPFINSHSAQYGNSSVLGSYNIVFDAASFDFQMTAHLTCQGDPFFFRSSATGSLSLSTTEPLTVSVSDTYHYALAPGDRESEYTVRVLRSGPVYFFNAGGGAMPVFGDPAIGQFSDHADSILLPGNASYTFGYSFALNSNTGSPTQLSQADATVHFHIETVPEPVTMIFLACAAPFIARRLRRLRDRP